MRKVQLPKIRRPVHFPIRRPWIPYIILVIALLITLLSTIYVIQSAEEIDRLRFNNAVEETQSSITNRVETYIALLRGGSGLFAANGNVTDEEFKLFVDRLRITERYPGIQGIGYAARVDDTNKEQFEAEVAAELGRDFRIVPENENAMYFPITYLEPITYKNNEAAVGFNMYSEPTRRRAMDKARDTGTRAASGKVTLVQNIDEKQQGSFLIYVPIYEGSAIPPTEEERREQIRGFVYSPFRADDLFTGIFNNPTHQQIHYQIYNGNTLNKSTLLHDSSTLPNASASSENPKYQRSEKIDIAGEQWTIVHTTNTQFDEQSQQAIAPFIFALGLMISGVVFMLSRAQYTARNNAEKLASQLLQSQKELEKAVSMRDNFISIASHELKTPVTSLKVYGEVMARKFTKSKQAENTQAITKMNNQIDKLANLISDLLDVTRIQAGKLAFREEKFDLTAAVKDVITATQPLSNNHKILFKGAPKIFVLGDSDRIGQVVSNFLTNAIKYSPDAKKVKVKVERLNNQAVVSVQDFGIGIDNPHQKKIFGRFYRVSDKDEQTFPGLGIGLYICFEIIKRHNGEIQVKSAKGKGSQFSFSLPLKKDNK
jgi:CHASE1-domain containing sensor protein/nitrogen-specific signal transduction histidine kinase